MHYLSGIPEPFNNIEAIKVETGFIFHSFNGEQSFLIKDLQPISPEAFKYYYHNTPPITINKEEYLKTCQALIDHLNRDEFSKIIYSRVAAIEHNKSPLTILEQLNAISKHTFNYIVSIPNIGTWMGASPEKLVTIDENKLETSAIAGTKKKSVSPWGAKEIEEQNIVTLFIQDVLTQTHCKNITKNGPIDLNTGVVTHLKTDFKADIIFNQWTHIVSKLHPTPATCGLPQHQTQLHINKVEQHQREYYTGFLGPIQHNKVQLYVNLRCMKLNENQAFLYLGGGLTKDSIAEKEWIETNNKAQTLIRTLV